MWLIYYIYAIFGMEYFSTIGRHLNPEIEIVSPFEVASYATFDSFGGAILILFQIMLNIDWGKIVFYYTKLFNDYPSSIAFFISYHIVIQFIFLALLKGIIWEIFTVLEFDEDQTKEIAVPEEIESLTEESLSENQNHTQLNRATTIKVVSPQVKFSSSSKRRKAPSTVSPRKSHKKTLQNNFNDNLV